MLRIIFIFTIISLASCGQTNKDNNVPTKTEEQPAPETQQPPVALKIEKTANALTFINGYVENSNKLGNSVDIIDWVKSSTLATTSFKAELKRIIDEAYKAEPEVGLDFDPILDAQDNPESFELESFDETTNYLVVRGKDWPEFNLVLKITDENGNWLVDGCGIINIPETKRAKR